MQSFEHIDLYLDAQSMADSFNGRPVKIKHYRGYSIQLVFTGAPNGTFTLQCSNDPDINNISNWIEVDHSNEVIITAGTTFYNVVDANYLFFRVVYTRASGTGSVTSRVVMKG